MTARYVAVFSAILLAGVVRAGDDKKDDKDKLQGEWMVVSMEVSGKQVANVKDLKVVVQDNEWTSPQGLKFTFVIDATTSPKQLDLQSKMGGRTWPGIYKIDGDRLTFCRSQGSGGERPTKFKGGPGVVLFQFKRLAK